jgi:pentatricopeptide repeat protein
MSTLIDGYVRAGRMEEAEGVLKSMQQRRIKGNVVLFNTLLRGYSKKGNMTVNPVSINLVVRVHFYSTFSSL